MADDIATEIQEIEDSMGDDFAGYQGDPAKQERYGALLQAQEDGSPAPDQPDATTVRKGELEVMMADQRSPYWKGSQSDRLQAEYRDLLGAERPAGDQGDAAGGDHQAVVVTEDDVSTALQNLAGMGTIGGAWSVELSKGGAKGALGFMEDQRRALLADMGGTADAVVIAFEANLTPAAKGAAYKELGAAFTPLQPDASADNLAQFRETPAGRLLAAEWKGRTAQLLGRCLFRWDRMGMDLEDFDADQLDDMFQRLTTAERASVLRQLAQ